MTPPDDLAQRALEYCGSREIEIDLLNVFGWGQDGWVWKTAIPTAIKVLRRYSNYDTEKRCYQRLMEKGVTTIEGLKVPQLIDFDDALMVIEIEVVDRPFLLDFGKAYIDEQPPDYGHEVLADEEERQRERWGRHYKRMRKVTGELALYGIIYSDPSPDNIAFADWDYTSEP
jgi:hypothetical protein